MDSSRPAGLGRRLALAVGSLAVVVPLAGLALSAGPASAGAAVRKAGTTSTCPSTGGIPFSGTLSKGTVTIGSAAKGTGVSGSVCGLLSAGSSGFSVSIPQSDITFAPTSITVVGLLSLPATISAQGNGTGTVTANSNGTFSASLTVPVSSTVSALGFNCTIGPFTPVLTTGTSGSVTGTPLSGSLSALSGTLVAGEFTVPAVQSSRSCPFIVAGLVNLITGLPLKAGKSTLTASASLSVGA